ncbi:sensor histidine kinase, partial [Lentzea sp. NPDC060358]|uniref:sensor histidine kinase n=1 Tax=Lentzea sp. NPDC060358 TaxID=3347103 RepID=UPI003650A497
VLNRRTQVLPVLVTAAVCAGVFVVTGLVSGFSRAVFADGTGVGTPPGLGTPPARIAEAAVVLALVLLLVWKVPPLPATLAVGALVLVSVHAAVIRADFDLGRLANALLVLPLFLVGVGGGAVLRFRDRVEAVTAAAAADRARSEERLDMARELHDVVAHYVTGMLVQAQAALVVAEADQAKACSLLPGIVDGGTDALGAMRAMVRTLRANGTTTATGDLTADLHQVAEKSGLPVRATVELGGDVRPELARSVLRLVQEALTNIRKHARDATDVEVDVRRTATAVLLSVVDNGTGRPAHSGGFGLVGMRERVDELGGRFFAGPTGEGWLVTAELPLEVRA